MAVLLIFGGGLDAKITSLASIDNCNKQIDSSNFEQAAGKRVKGVPCFYEEVATEKPIIGETIQKNWSLCWKIGVDREITPWEMLCLECIT